MITPLSWLAPGDPFPDTELTWGALDPVPGLLAAGGALDVPTLLAAYRNGIFPWFGESQPILWWSPDPRMVLDVAHFRLHRSLRRRVRDFARDPRCEIRFDSAFKQVILACAQIPRPGQIGTWIVAPMVDAYVALHRAGYAHSVETWIDGELAGGLYCVGIGRAVFGESMFARRTDASKIALTALVAFCRQHGIARIDCQQKTAHLASLGAREIPRTEFLADLRNACALPAPAAWRFDSRYWV